MNTKQYEVTYLVQQKVKVEAPSIGEVEIKTKELLTRTYGTKGYILTEINKIKEKDAA